MNVDECPTTALQINIRLFNTTSAQFNMTSGTNHAHFQSSIRIQIQINLLVEQIQI